MGRGISGDDLDVRFDYHAPETESDVEAHRMVRRQCESVAAFILTRTEAGREQSLAVTKLEEAMMWANAALARDRARRALESGGSGDRG